MKQSTLTVAGSAESNAFCPSVVISSICHALCLRHLLMIVTLILLNVLGGHPVYGQTPQGFTYQALAMTSVGEPIRSQALPVRITIQSDSLGGTIFWFEEHATVTTNSTGFFTLVVGKGTRLSGTAASFADIDWTVTPKFIKTEINNGTWQTMGSSRLWSVPYAMTAGDITGSLKKLEVAGDASAMDDALFEVKNKNGQTVFAVYNEGVRIYVGDGSSKAVKGGFAIGTFDESKADTLNLMVVNKDSVRVYIYDDPLNKAVKGGFAIGGFDESKSLTNDYLLVSPDSVRVYIDKDPAKAVKGGFAIGGFDMSKAPGQEFLRITNDSIRMYVSDDPSKAVKGGFAIGSFDESKKGPAVNFTSLTPQNYFIGHSAGNSTSTGLYNSFIGFEAGKSNISGSNNVFMGYRAGYYNTQGDSNLFLGYLSGYRNTTGSSNTFVGVLTGLQNTSGEQNTFVGSYSGASNNDGNQNSFVGYYAGFRNIGGHGNSFFGNYAGFSNQTGSNNILVGPQTGFSNNGDNNVFMGFQTGRSNTIGGSNVLIGNLAGFSGTTAESNVIIGDSAGFGNTNSFNVFLGKGTGKVNTGQFNTFLGFRAGMKNIYGNSNVFIGYRSGYSNIGTSPAGGYGDYNTYIGTDAGLNNTTGAQNVYLGFGAGQGASTGSTGESNVFVGFYAGSGLTSGRNDIFIGFNSGFNNTTGENNIFLGPSSGHSNTVGKNNIYIGSFAGLINTDGEKNVYIGVDAGRLNTGTGNVFIGYQANAFGSDKLIIENSNSSTPLIWGDFLARSLAFNGSVSIVSTGDGANVLTLATERSWAFQQENTGTATALRLRNTTGKNFNIDTNGSTQWRNGDGSSIVVSINHTTGFLGIGDSSPDVALDVVGDINYTGTIIDVSDVNLKKEIVTLTNVLDKISRVRGVEYSFIDTVKYGSARQIGMIAQEMQKEFPTLVSEMDDGILGVNTVDFSAVLLEAIKEQQKQIDYQDGKLEEQRLQLGQLTLRNQQIIEEMQSLRAEVEALKAVILNGNR